MPDSPRWKQADVPDLAHLILDFLRKCLIVLLGRSHPMQWLFPPRAKVKCNHEELYQDRNVIQSWQTRKLDHLARAVSPDAFAALAAKTGTTCHPSAAQAGQTAQFAQVIAALGLTEYPPENTGLAIGEQGA